MRMTTTKTDDIDDDHDKYLVFDETTHSTLHYLVLLVKVIKIYFRKFAFHSGEKGREKKSIKPKRKRETVETGKGSGPMEYGLSPNDKRCLGGSVSSVLVCRYV